MKTGKTVKKKAGWYVIAALILVSGGAVYFSLPAPVASEVTPVVRRDIVSYIQDTASVRYSNTVTIYAEGTGRVVLMDAEAGDAVKAGELLARMDEASLELQLRDARSRVAGARALLKGTDKGSYSNRAAMAGAAVEQARVAYASALRDFESMKKMYETSTASQNELDKAQDACLIAKSALDSAEAALRDAQSGSPAGMRESYAASLDQALIYEESILEGIKKQEIRAPFDGIILEKLISKDTYVLPGTPAFVIGDNSVLELEGDILADDAAVLKTGCRVVANGSISKGKTVRGRVSAIAPEARTVLSALGLNQKSVAVTVSLEGDVGYLKPGYEMDIKITTGEKQGVLAVPESSVFEYEGKSSVFIAVNGRAVLRGIEKGIEGEDLIEVLSGLNAGDIVLVKPGNSMKPGMKVKAHLLNEAATNTAGVFQ